MVQSPGQAALHIRSFKNLICSAVERVAAELPDTNVGVIVDERYGESVLSRLTADNWWIGRPVEIPGSRPVHFDPRDNIGLPLQQWPATQTVKCLVFYHPDDEPDLRLQQEGRVRQLYADCAELGRDLLLEVIASSTGKPCDDGTIARALRRFYNIGVYPAWWKLEPQTHEGWTQVSDVIRHYDSHCNGVLLLGLDAPEDTLRESFEIAGPFEICRWICGGA